jgi:hypothetical protein
MAHAGRGEVAGLRDRRFYRQEQGGVGFRQDHRQVVGVVLVLVGLRVVQFPDDPGDGGFALRQIPRQADESVGVPLAVRLHGLDDQGHDAGVGRERLGEVGSRPVPNLGVGAEDGFLDLVFG